MKTEIVCKVKVSGSANDWELYSSVTGVGAAARKLSAAATKAINAAHKEYATTKNKGAAINAAWCIWDTTSREFSKFGANDTEPRWHFQDLLNRLFCKPHNISY
jgi:hypothetical protein